MKRMSILVVTLILSASLSYGAAGDLPQITFFGGIGTGQSTFSVKEKGNWPENWELTMSNAENELYTWAYTFGIILNYRLVSSLYLTGGLAYAHKPIGYAIYDSSVGKDISKNILENNYLQIPVSLRWGKTFYLGAGGYYAFRLGDSMHIDRIDHIGEKSKVEDQFAKNYDFGLLFELGFHIMNTVELGLRFELGMVEVYSSPVVGLKNSGLQFILGIEFDFLN